MAIGDCVRRSYAALRRDLPIGKPLLLPAAASLIAGVCLLAAPTAASASGCPNEAFRTGPSANLPDCRAYEQVSPTEKNGTDVLGYETDVRAAANGERVTFASYGAFAEAEGLKGFEPYLAIRGSQGWSSKGLYPPQEATGTAFESMTPIPMAYSEELTKVVLELGEPAPPGITEAQPNTNNLYLRDLETGAYTLLTSEGTATSTAVAVDGASADFSHILFESGAKLTPEAPVDDPTAQGPQPVNLYEWVDGKVQLVDILPGGEVPTWGGRAGAVTNAQPSQIEGGGIDLDYTLDTISEDGSRVFWTDPNNQQLYVRLDGRETIQVSASQRSEPDPAGTQPAVFRAATPDGADVFFTSTEKLTNDSNAEESYANLYEYEVESGRLTDLTVASSGSASVIGVLGTSTDGSYVYFVAGGAPLADGAPRESELDDEVSLYVWHAGQISYIARLSDAGGAVDPRDWEINTLGGDMPKLSRATPSGGDLLFASERMLTGYDNDGYTEFYRYDASSQQLTCVSCNPSGTPPSVSASFGTGAPDGVATVRMAPVLTNVLSEDGSRVFFQSEEELLPTASNGLANVYEWEEGHLYLISTGDSSYNSYLGDASRNGNDVFFVTRESLVGQDQDANVDLYDARVDGGSASQNPPPASPLCVGTECRESGSEAPVHGAPASESFAGPGNLAASKPKPKPLTRAQKLAKALRACARKPRAAQPRCRRAARKRYGNLGRAHKASAHHAKSVSRRSR